MVIDKKLRDKLLILDQRSLLKLDYPGPGRPPASKPRKK